jgi:hypothetical protein
MELVLSHIRGTWEHSSPKSLSVYVIQSSCEQQLAVETYSASVVDWLHHIVCEKTKKPAKIPETGKYPKLISDRLYTPWSRHPKNQEVKEKRTLSNKDRTQDCIEDT